MSNLPVSIERKSRCFVCSQYYFHNPAFTFGSGAPLTQVGYKVKTRLRKRRRQSLQNFKRERNDLHESFAAQFARDRSENARTDRLELVVEQHGSIAVEADQRPVGAAYTFLCAHDNRVVDLALLHLAARNCLADRHLDDITDAGIAALG